MNRIKSGIVRTRALWHAVTAVCALLALPAIAAADTIMLSWTSVPKAEGYKVYVFPGEKGSSLYTIDVGAVGSDRHGVVRHSVEITDAGADSFVAVTAYDAAGAESDLCNREPLPEVPAKMPVRLERHQ